MFNSYSIFSKLKNCSKEINRQLYILSSCTIFHFLSKCKYTSYKKYYPPRKNLKHVESDCCHCVAETAASQMFSSLWVTKATMAQLVFVSWSTTCSSVCMAVTRLLLHSLLCSVITPALPVSWPGHIAGSSQRAWSRCAEGLLYALMEPTVYAHYLDSALKWKTMFMPILTVYSIWCVCIYICELLYDICVIINNTLKLFTADLHTTKQYVLHSACGLCNLYLNNYIYCHKSSLLICVYRTNFNK